MEKVIKARWQNWEGDAIEDLIMKETSDGLFVDSTIVSRGKDPFTASYTLAVDASWRVKGVTIELAEKKEKLEFDGLGSWSNDAGVITELQGAIDIDISATPFTNTLPIRRLGLNAGESAEISAVYITLPDLDTSLNGQRYTCIIPNRLYRYESLDSDFVREIEVDEDGLVLLYPDLFKRI